MKIILYLLCISFFSFPSYAGIFNPSSKQQCIEKYVPKAKTKYAAYAYHSACTKLFANKPSKEDFVLEETQKTHKFTQEDYKNMSNEKFSDVIDGIGMKSQIRAQKATKSWNKGKDWANCILNKKKLRDVETDIGANVLIQSCDEAY